MNKELGRKITSLTLMTIMLTWSAAMGFSGSFMPEAEAANQYLWVSAEDAGGNNFYGGQVLEIVVTDPAINRLDEAYGMPDVTIDGKKVIMAQGVDGSWYAYIADGKTASINEFTLATYMHKLNYYVSTTCASASWTLICSKCKLYVMLSTSSYILCIYSIVLLPFVHTDI